MFFFKKWKYAEYQRESGSSKQKLFCISDDFCLAFPRDNLVFTEFATVAIFMICDISSAVVTLVHQKTPLKFG